MFERYIKPVYWGEAQNDTNYSWAKGKTLSLQAIQTVTLRRHLQIKQGNLVGGQGL